MTMTREPVAFERSDRRRFSADEYFRMAECGILSPDERTELLDGEIFRMAPAGPAHSSEVDRLCEFFVLRLHGRAQIRVQSPVRMGPSSVPEPDLALLRLRESGYREHHPGAGDLLLAVEVSDSSLDFDLGRKARLYARHGVPELWVFDIGGRRIVVHREARDEGYAGVFEARAGDRLAPAAFEADVIDVAELLGEGWVGR
jgi:Uma2 family endonuclease